MNAHDLPDNDSDSLTVTTQGDRTWITCTSGDSEVTVGPFATDAIAAGFPTDPMDGGVTAALIEKEARSGASLAAHFRDKRDMERARAEKAERERDEARGALRARLGVLAEPPARPEWADIEDALNAGWPEGINGAENSYVARNLHTRGVRVVGEEQS